MNGMAPREAAAALLAALGKDVVVQKIAISFLAALGSLTVARALANFFSAVWRIFLRPGKNLRRYGEWAIVTGCTDGIGKAFCEELAKKKMKLILISRTKDKLLEQQAELKTKFKAESKIVAADFSKATEATYNEIKAAIDGLEVGVLINNVGLSYPHAMYLDEMEDQYAEDMISINCRATVRMTKAVLPGMLKRRKGAIVNIGSAAATVLPSDPLYSMYAGTKGFVDQFSRTMHTEYKDKGIHVQLQAPLFVVSKMSKIRRASLTVPSAKQYAKAALAAVGYEPRTTPYWSHALMWGAIASLPVWAIDSFRLWENKKLRKRGFAAAERKKAALAAEGKKQ